MWLVLHLSIILGLSIRVLLRPHRDPESRIAWILFISALPFLGAVAYLLLGEVRPGRVSSKMKNPDSAHISHSAIACSETENTVIPENARSAFFTGESISGFAAVGGNTGRLLADSNASIDAMVADIDAATDHVHILFYIWLSDTNGRKVVDAVVRAAKRGILCRVIIDDLGSRKFIRSDNWSEMKAAGAHLSLAQPIGNIIVRMLKGRVDVRNHRKIVVIDNDITFCGSQNCADPEFAVKPKYAPWVDAVVRFEGPIARQNQHLFLSDWMAYTGEDVSELLQEPISSAEHGVLAQAIGTGPLNRYSAMPELFVTLMFSANRELVITTPYYIPDESMQAALCACARRGVDTTIVFPARNDSWFVGSASRSYYAELLAAGVQIHEYVGGLLHTKSLTVDGEMTLIGSANMDRRSFDLNFENNILFHDHDLTQGIRARQAEYIASSNLITEEDVAGWSIGHRLSNNFTAILGPVL